MRKLTIIMALSFWMGQEALAQSVPVSTAYHDQLLQGPCFVFATVAALESKAIEAGWSTATDFYEWNLYSRDVLESAGLPGGIPIFKKIIKQASSANGIFSAANLYRPTEADGLPNADEILYTGMAKWQAGCGAPSLKNATYTSIEDVGCQEVLDTTKLFTIRPYGGYRFQYNYTDSSGYVEKDPSDVVSVKTDVDILLSQGKGVIIYVNNYDGDGSGGYAPTTHALFVYGKSGSSYRFKDSWPGNPGNKVGGISFHNVYRYFYLTGTFDPPCSATITGSSSVSGPTNFSLSGSDAYTHIQWTVSGGLKKVSTSNGGKTLRVTPNGCSGTATITLQYKNKGQSCTQTKTVNLTASPAVVPSGINVLSLDWNNSQTCPNTILELEAIDHVNPSAGTVYDWSVSGATLLSGDGTPTIFARTGSGNLTFRVRANSYNCGYSGWRTLTGNTYAPGCGGGGGGGFFRPAVQEQTLELRTISDLPQNLQSFDYQLVSLDGRIVKEGQVRREDLSINLVGVDERVMILFLLSEDEGYFEQVKILK
ncbi:MAG TPA: hypothetical protein DCP28_16610 [Cytophagales bacterium]|nr:hypothetical protein [Cytophagales bacterium]